MTAAEIVGKTRDELLQHTAAKGRLTFVVGPYCYGKARAGHTAYGIARDHLPAFVANGATFTVFDAPEDSAVDVKRRQVVTPSGRPAPALGSF